MLKIFLNIFSNAKSNHRLIAGLVSALIILCGCDNNSSTEEAEKEILRPVQYQLVEQATGGRIRTYSGTAKAESEVELSFKVAGTVQEIAVKVGDSLAPGKPIASLDRTSFELNVEKSRAGLAQAKAENRNARAKYQRVRELYENNNSSQDDLDSARAAVDSAKAMERSAGKSLELALLDLGYTRLKSSEQCSVAEVLKEVNENIKAGEAIIGVTCGSVNEVEVRVPENLIGYIEPGMSATVHYSAIPDKNFTAEITEVGVTATGGATFPVTLFINEEHRLLRSGLAAEVSFHFGESNDGSGKIYLPPVAVGQDTAGRFVFLVEATARAGEAVIKRRPVTVGELTSQGLEIKSGVELGNKVVTAGMSVIRDGLHVKAE